MPALAWRLLHVLALCTLAITQPLLAILGDNPTFFTAHDSSGAQVVGLAVVVALVPALLLSGLQAGLHVANPRWSERLHLAILAALTFLVVIQIADLLPGPWIVPTAAAIAVTGTLVALYLARAAIRSVVSMLALTPIVFVALFLFVSPASSVVFPDDVAAVELDELLGETLASGAPGSIDPSAAPPTLAERVARRFPPIYFLVFDELPMASLLDETGEIDRARWPNFARLADTSHLFSNTTTIGFTTERVIPGMLTARYETQAAPVYSLYPENLFTLLGDIYDISSSDPLVDLCPPSICNGAPPRAMLDLLTSDEQVETSPTVATTTTMPPQPVAPAGPDSSFRLLLDDALIVFGHLATPDGLDIGLPPIGTTWGDFGGDSGVDRAPTSSVAPRPPAPSTPTPPLEVAVGQLPVDDAVAVDVDVDVDVDAVNDANTEVLERLITDDSRAADFRAEVAAITAVDTPRLHYTHTLLPHVPWRLHPDGETYADVELPGYVTMWDDDPTTARAGQQRHLLQAQFADRLLGEYLDRLEQEGIFDDATVIVVADHGVSFIPGNRARGLDRANTGGIAGVPLFYKLPGQSEPDRHLDPVEVVDIVPTIAAQIDIEIPWPTDGVDLFGPPLDRVRALHHPFWAEIPEPFLPWMDEITAELLATFGNGDTGSLYGLAGLHDRIGTSIADLLDDPTSYCWVLERPGSLPDDDGGTGFVYGRLATSGDERVRLAVTVGEVLTGTSVSLDHDDTRHRVYAFGDPGYWDEATIADIGLHEIVDDRLHPIPTC